VTVGEPERPLLADVRREIGGLIAEVRAMVALRGQLAGVELRGTIGAIRQLLIRLVVVAAVTVVAVSVLAVAAAEGLAWWLDLDRLACLAVCGGVLLVIAAGGGYLAWRGFRSRFCGMEQSLEELREDLLWLKQWAGQIDEHPDGD
jgi:hypothetical protein